MFELEKYFLEYFFNMFTEVILLRDLSARDRLVMKDGQAESPLPRQSVMEGKMNYFSNFLINLINLVAKTVHWKRIVVRASQR